MARSLQTATGFSVVATDREGLITSFNRGAELMLGYTSDDLVGRRNCLALHLPSEVAARGRALAAELGRPVDGFQVLVARLESQDSETGEWTYVRRDGSALPVSLTTTALRSASGEVVGYLGIATDLSEQRRARSILQEQEQRLGAITRNLPGVVFRFYADADGRHGLSYVSERLTEIFGLVYDDIEDLYPVFLSRIHEEDREAFQESVRRAVQSVSPWSFEGRFCKPSGEVIWFHGRSVPLRQADGLTFDGLLLDVTERKLAEQALSRRIMALTRPLEDSAGVSFEELFNLADIQRLQDEFAQATGVASIITRTDGTPITVPSGFCRLCIDVIRGTRQGRANCYRSDATLGRLSTRGPTVQPCMSGGLWDAGAGISVGGRHVANWLIGQVRDETQTEEAVRRYAREIGADEEEAALAFQEVPAMSRQRFERVAQVLFTLANQLSDMAYQNVQQARFIADRQSAEQRSRESEDRFHKVFMTTPDCIAITRMQDGQVIDVNWGFEEVLGWKRAEVVGRRTTESDIVFWDDPSDRDRMVADLAVHGEVLHREFRFHAADGSLRTGIYSARPITIEGEACLVFILQDTTSRKALEEDRRKLEQQLFQSQKMDAIGQLAGGVAHDFNNILMGIQGIASVMLVQCRPEHPNHRGLKHIEGLVKRGANLTRQLLEVARGGKYEVTTVAVNDLVRKCLQFFAETRKEIETDLQLRDAAHAVEADAGQLEQVLLNLFLNAAQAMPSGGRLRVETANMRLTGGEAKAFEVSPGDFVRISVSDTGTGIDRATLKRIFEPFFTTRARQGGTGMGLASAYGIVRNHGGAIHVYSEVGRGSTFNVYFPASDRVARREEAASAEEVVPGNARVLLVDDEPVILEAATQMLAEMGYTVCSATSGSEAVSLFRERKGAIDLVILDMVLPGTDGSQVLLALQEIDPDVKVVLSSGYGRQGDVQRLMAMGCRGFIQKPYGAVELSRLLQQVL